MLINTALAGVRGRETASLLAIDLAESLDSARQNDLLHDLCL